MDDILSVAQCPPNLLATSSYDGEVIIWSTVSGHIHCHLRAPLPSSTDSQDTCESSTRLVTFKELALYKNVQTLFLKHDSKVR